MVSAPKPAAVSLTISVLLDAVMLITFVAAVRSKIFDSLVTPAAPVVSTSLVTLLPAVIPVLSDALKPASGVAVESGSLKSRLSGAAFTRSLVMSYFPVVSLKVTV